MMFLDWWRCLGWTSEPQSQTRNRTFNCRFLVKPPDDKEETMEEKQQRVSRYEAMQICSALLPHNSDRLEGSDVSSESSDISHCVMCVARRIPQSEKPFGSSIEQFTIKLDTNGKIIEVDVSWLSPVYSKYLNKVKETQHFVQTTVPISSYITPYICSYLKFWWFIYITFFIRFIYGPI